MRARVCIRALGVAVAIVVTCAAARGQGAPAGPIHLKPGATPEAPAQQTQRQNQQKPGIRVNVSEVTAPVTVVNAKGETVFDLGAADFQIYDNGAPQKIDHFGLGGDQLSIVLVAEDSSRIEALLPAVQKMGIIFTQTVMGQSADAAVIGYDDSVNVLANFTSNRDSVQATINHLRMGTSGAHLYDAMERGVAMLQEQPAARRRIMVVVGEAHDAGSQSKLGGVLRAAQLANVTIYSVGLSTTAAEMRAPASQSGPPSLGPEGTYPLPAPNGTAPTPQVERDMQGNMNIMALAQLLVETGMNAVRANALEVASKATGGLHVNTHKDGTIQKAMDAIGGELHSQYTITYRPAENEPGGYHHIRVTVSRPGMTVRTRPGYYLAPQ